MAEDFEHRVYRAADVAAELHRGGVVDGLFILVHEGFTYAVVTLFEHVEHKAVVGIAYLFAELTALRAADIYRAALVDLHLLEQRQRCRDAVEDVKLHVRHGRLLLLLFREQRVV